jgi:aspartate/methionine/tyrosine aminotransferase
MPNVTDWAGAVPISGVREIFHRIAGRDDIFHLEIGEPNFPTPSHIIEAAAESARAGSGYVDSAGVRDLRQAIRDKLVTANAFDIETEQVIVTQGGIQGCSLVFSSLVKPGGEVLIPDPGWPNFEMLALLHGAVPVPYPLHPDRGFLPDPDEIRALTNENTQLIVMNTPANPSGSLFPDDLVDEFLKIAEDLDVVVLADEVYDELIFDGHRPANAFNRSEGNVVSLYSFSKSYAMTGWRVGYVVGPPNIAPTLALVQQALISSLPTMTQAGALAAITGPQDEVAFMREAYQSRRDAAVKLLADGGIDVIPPTGGFYLMVPLKQGADSWKAAFDLIDHQVAVSPGAAYGEVTKEYLRLSLASSERDIEEGISRIVSWYQQTDGGTNIPS